VLYIFANNFTNFKNIIKRLKKWVTANSALNTFK